MTAISKDYLVETLNRTLIVGVYCLIPRIMIHLVDELKSVCEEQVEDQNKFHEDWHEAYQTNSQYLLKDSSITTVKVTQESIKSLINKWGIQTNISQ